MIRIDRSREPIPEILTGPNSKGGKETARAIAYYKGNNRSKPFNFSAYSDGQVKDALIRLFKGKCAYCEGKFLHVYAGDIEHFRPKGEITEANPTKPGYYWLASDWDNLLLSCRNCNQKLKHQIHGRPGKETMGKMNQFPLSDASKYIRAHDIRNGVQDEEPFRLLLNPCLENPEDYLEYDTNHAIIKPRIINGQPSPKGAKSIDVYVLQRVPLVLAREKVLIEILAQIQRVKEAVKNVNDHLEDDMEVQFFYNRILRRELKCLKKFTDPSEEFSGMAKQVIGEFLLTNFSIRIK